jgi:hypothetical protein
MPLPLTRLLRRHPLPQGEKGERRHFLSTKTESYGNQTVSLAPLLPLWEKVPEGRMRGQIVELPNGSSRLKILYRDPCSVFQTPLLR